MTLTHTQWQAYVPSPKSIEGKHSFVLVRQASQSELKWLLFLPRLYRISNIAVRRRHGCNPRTARAAAAIRGCFWFRNLHRKSVSDHLHQLHRHRRRHTFVPDFTVRCRHTRRPDPKLQFFFIASMHPMESTCSPMIVERSHETLRLTFVCVTCAPVQPHALHAARWRHSASSTVPIFAIQRALTPHTNASFIGYFESFFFLSVNWRVHKPVSSNSNDSHRQPEAAAWKQMEWKYLHWIRIVFVRNNKALKINCSSVEHKGRAKWKWNDRRTNSFQ